MILFISKKLSNRSIPCVSKRISFKSSLEPILRLLVTKYHSQSVHKSHEFRIWKPLSLISPQDMPYTRAIYA